MDDDLIGSRGPGDPDASEYPDRDPGDEHAPPPFTDF
jgi:hypothetical protein